MIGAGVLLSTGFMAQQLGPGSIMGGWLLGAVLATLGAMAYASIATISGRSGGEYRYLSDYLSPFLGYLSGWGSLILGFTAPIAVDALAFAAFLQVIFPALPVTGTAASSIVLLTLANVTHVRAARGTQNLLVVVKVCLLAGVVAIGVTLGSSAWPTWTPREPAVDGAVATFLLQQYWIAFAFSGWNAAIYAAGEFRRPRLDVPRAMWMGCVIVGALYLALNWVFVANLDPGLARVVYDYELRHVTLAHALLEKLIGPIGATVAALMLSLVFLSAMNAMTFAGPRVYAAMAADGFLPQGLRMQEGRLPAASVLLQGGLALAFVFTHDILEAVQTTSSVLMLFSGLTVLCLFRIRARPDLPKPGPAALLAAALYACCMAWLLILGVTRFGHLGWEFMLVLALATLFYLHAARRRMGSARAPHTPA
jgi:APA family basic amino acid/polyamine antiporter